MGPLMLDLLGCELSPEEQELLAHPTTGGVILFSRNYDSPQQIQRLCEHIRDTADGQVLIAVDHEGGRVQRFRDGFSAIPAMGRLYQGAGEDLNEARTLARELGWLMAAEVLAVGIDISFAPVLDICGISQVIGERGFHHEPDIIIAIAAAFITGMNEAGMGATGKHFPGHGNVLEDSHVAIPIDRRSKAQIFDQDMRVFGELIEQGLLAAMMPAHVIYPAVDEQLPAGFSPLWIKQQLRTQLNFTGVVFSDDLSMHGASLMGDHGERAKQALAAGCDMVLACNNRQGAIEVLDGLPIVDHSALTAKLLKLRGQSRLKWQQRGENPRWRKAQDLLQRFY